MRPILPWQEHDLDAVIKYSNDQFEDFYFDYFLIYFYYSIYKSVVNS